jgi:hypothetical protein
MTTMLQRILLTLVLLVALTASLAAPLQAGTASAAPLMQATRTHAAFLDKTRFVLHMGAAYYAFHHFVWKRYKAGQLNLHHKVNLIKAGIAMLFTYHELKVAYSIAKGSNSKLLHALIAPINTLMAAAQSAGNRLKGGQLSTSDLTNFNSSANLLQGTASANGYAFHDQTVPVPGAS